MTLLPRIVNLARERDLSDVLIFAGGIIPQEDIQKLKEQGISEIFTPGATTEDAIRFLRENVKPR